MRINTIRKVDIIRAMIVAAFFASKSGYAFHIISASWVLLMLLFYKYKRAENSVDNYPALAIMLVVSIILLGSMSVWFGFSLGSDEVLTNESFTGSIRLNILAVMTIISVFGSFFLINRSSFSEAEVSKILRFILFCGGISAFVTLMFWFAETGGQWGRYNYVPPLSESQGAQFYYLAISFLAGVTLLANVNSYRSRQALYLYPICAMILLCMTTILVREGWVIFSLSLILAFSQSGMKSSLKKYLSLTIFIVFLLLFGTTMNSVVDLTTDVSISDGIDNAESVLIRFQMITKAFAVFLDNPLLGIGYGNFPNVVSHEILLQSGGSIEVSSPHNGVVLMLAEIGILGFLAFNLMAILLFKRMRERTKSTRRNVRKSLYKVFGWFFVLLYLDQFVANSLFLPLPNEASNLQLSWLLWIIVALTLSQPKVLKSN